jgi:hypothetical protein
MPPGIASPDKVECRLGRLPVFDGFPDKASAAKLLDNLDFQRAVQAYLLALQAVSQAANRNAIRTLGPVNQVVPIFEQLLDARSIFLTANDNTVYSWTWLDLSQGPLDLEVPQGTGSDQRPSRPPTTASGSCSTTSFNRSQAPPSIRSAWVTLPRSASRRASPSLQMNG